MEKLLEEIDIENCKPFEKNVGIIHDEVKIKGDLVFSKSTGQIIGFVDIGDFNNKLSDFEKKCEGKGEDPEVATHVLVLMVRGLFSKLAFPFAHFACQGFRTDLLLTSLLQVCFLGGGGSGGGLIDGGLFHLANTSHFTTHFL